MATSGLFAPALPSSLSGHQPSFSHGILTPGRILARKIHNPLSGAEESKVVAIVDCEAAGWYPTYWEYAYANHNFKWYKDWSEHLKSPSTLSQWKLLC